MGKSLMLSVVPYRRMVVLTSAVTLAFVGLVGWLAHLQLHFSDDGPTPERSTVSSRTARPGRRGAILDCRGTVLAMSVPTKMVCADPSLIFTQHVAIAKNLAPLLQMKELELLSLISPRIRTNSADGRLITNSYVVLKRKVPIDTWQQVTQAMARLEIKLPGRRIRSSQKLARDALRYRSVFGSDDYLRHYPSGTLAAHVLGYVSSAETNTDYGPVFEDRGLTGIELTCDKALAGVHGWAGTGGGVEPKEGLNVVLTLDATIQAIVEDELAAAMKKYSPAGACAIAVRPFTGDILAMASAPAFDPNSPASGVDGWRNRAISDLTEPGSTFKIVTITTCLEEGILTLEDTVDCEHGRWWYGGAWLHDVHPYGVLPYETVICKSSNIGTAKAAVRLGPGRLYQAVRNFGFGQRTGIPLPAEAAGVIRPTNQWSKLSITRVPIGQEVSATPLQMVLAMSAIANGGTLMSPRLIDRLEDSGGRVIVQYPASAVRRVASERVCRDMVRALKKAVNREGTASAAELESYTVAGKTGTAQKFVDGTYKSGKYYASFIGFFPADRPAVCIVVGIDEPDRRVGYMGGTVAAPVFKAMAERIAAYLHLPPDKPSDAPGTGQTPALAARERVEPAAKVARQ
ncbi:MAG: peptidoglycan D,D-transpeptidase FtsI family protein [Verrucomicrobiia bacterium]